MKLKVVKSCSIKKYTIFYLSPEELRTNTESNNSEKTVPLGNGIYPSRMMYFFAVGAFVARQ